MTLQVELQMKIQTGEFSVLPENISIRKGICLPNEKFQKESDHGGTKWIKNSKAES